MFFVNHYVVHLMRFGRSDETSGERAKLARSACEGPDDSCSHRGNSVQVSFVRLHSSDPAESPGRPSNQAEPARPGHGQGGLDPVLDE